MQTYCLSNRVALTTHSTRMPVLLVRDAPIGSQKYWELFDEHSLEIYFSKGIQRLNAKLAKFADLSEAWDEAKDRDLEFMLESLIHARQVLKKSDSASAMMHT